MASAELRLMVIRSVSSLTLALTDTRGAPIQLPFESAVLAWPRSDRHCPSRPPPTSSAKNARNPRHDNEALPCGFRLLDSVRRGGNAPCPDCHCSETK